VSDTDASPQEALALAVDMGYPVVLKVVSPQIVHKTDAGGVKVNINSDEEVMRAYDEIIASAKAYDPNAEIIGLMVDEMVSGTELIVGTTRDPHFGPMIMFGIGGIFVEVYKDVSFRLIPISEADAEEMIGEIKGKAMFQGARGLPKAETADLVNVLMMTSRFMEENPDVNELDINPLVITQKGIMALDARVILKK